MDLFLFIILVTYCAICLIILTTKEENAFRKFYSLCMTAFALGICTKEVHELENFFGDPALISEEVLGIILVVLGILSFIIAGKCPLKKLEKIEFGTFCYIVAICLVNLTCNIMF